MNISNLQNCVRGQVEGGQVSHSVTPLCRLISLTNNFIISVKKDKNIQKTLKFGEPPISKTEEEQDKTCDLIGPNTPIPNIKSNV